MCFFTSCKYFLSWKLRFIAITYHESFTAKLILFVSIYFFIASVLSPSRQSISFLSSPNSFSIIQGRRKNILKHDKFLFLKRALSQDKNYNVTLTLERWFFDLRTLSKHSLPIFDDANILRHKLEQKKIVIFSVVCPCLSAFFVSLKWAKIDKKSLNNHFLIVI